MARFNGPLWSDDVVEWFELHKPGYMKRFVMCKKPEQAVELGHIASMAGATITRFETRSHRGPPHCHYYLPDDHAQATLELVAYYTAPHEQGDHMRGRRTET